MARALGLVLDLSCAGFAAVVDSEGRALARRWRPPLTRHDDVGEWVEGCLAEAGGGFSELDWIGVGVGPGSFTGLRIALAFAQGLAMPKALPLQGFTSFAPLLLSAGMEVGAVAAIPSNAGRFYAARSLNDPGAVLEAGDLRRLGAEGATLIIPCDMPAFDAVRSAFGRVQAMGEDWNVERLVALARASGRDAGRPYYLTPPAAEAKAGLA